MHKILAALREASSLRYPHCSAVAAMGQSARLCQNGWTTVGRIAAWVLLCLCVPLCMYPAPPQPGTRWPPPAKRYALIIGINDYSSDIGSISGAVADAKSIRDALISYCAFPARQITLLT